MEITQLRYFLAVARLGSFSRAAQQCHVAQPSLSQQIAKLEKYLGQPLFHRLGRRVVLTGAGQLLLERAGAIIAALDDTERQLRDKSDEQKSHLCIGAIPTIAPYFLPPILEKFVARHENVQLTMHEDVTQHLIEATVTGELDLAVVALPLNDERLEIEPLFSEPLLLALPPGHRLEKRARIALDDLREERFILLNEMHCLSDQIVSFCRAHAYLPRIGCRSAQIATIQSLIKAGQGVSLIPAMAQKDEPNEPKACVYRHFVGKELSRTVALIWHRHRYHSLAERQFLEAIRTAARELEKQAKA